MKSTILHIVNGSAMLDRFSSGPWSGEVVAWEEAFIEGPLEKNILDNSFWQNRSKYLERVYDIKYRSWQRTLFAKIKTTSTYYLWFEYDTFCQMNMVGALAVLLTLKPTADIYLVQIGATEMERDITYGYATESEWEMSFERRKFVNDSDREFLLNYWQQITTLDIEILSTVFKANIPETFHYLNGAFQRVKYLFPDKTTGTNIIDRKFIDHFKSGSSLNDAIRNLLSVLHDWGFGDLQISKALSDSELFDYCQRNQTVSADQLKVFLTKRTRTQQFSNFNWNEYVYNSKDDIVEKKPK